LIARTNTQPLTFDDRFSSVVKFANDQAHAICGRRPHFGGVSR
jgi:hypothetical protein